MRCFFTLIIPYPFGSQILHTAARNLHIPDESILKKYVIILIWNI